MSAKVPVEVCPKMPNYWLVYGGKPMKRVLRTVRLLLENTNADNLGLMKASIKFQLAKLDQVANLHESYLDGSITADEAMRCAYKNGPIEGIEKDSNG